MNWKRWFCWLRAKHVARHPFVRCIPEPPYCPQYVMLGRRCWCGEVSEPGLKYDFKPGGIIMYDLTWPYVQKRT